jgi:monofunctional biosynthetic peptidoglycan transglycosylase
MRKLKELLITLLLEQHLTKRRILELYINVIEWGRGIFGIEAASQTYFGKSASELTLDEAARLAAVIPSPLRHRADADSRYVVRRLQIVLNRMRARNFIEITPSKETKSNQPPESRLEINDSSLLPDSSELIYPTDVDEDTSDGL